jgi:hypothetical protein
MAYEAPAHWTRRHFLTRTGVGAVSLAVMRQSRAGTTELLGTANPVVYLPFDPPSSSELRQSKRNIFTHWHFFPRSFDNEPASQDYYARNFLRPEGEHEKYAAFGGYIRERPLPRPVRSETDWQAVDMVDDIKAIAAIGVDAVQLNLPDIASTQPYWNYFTTMLSAAIRSGTNAKIMPCLDCTGSISNLPIDTIIETLSSVFDHPGLMRSGDGRIYISSFYAEKWLVERWRALLHGLAARGHPPYFFPVFLNLDRASPTQLALADMVSVWTGDSLASLSYLPDKADQTRRSGKAWCEPIWPQDFRPKDQWYAEASNSQLFRQGWEQAINMEAEAIDIITWNDYSEGSEIQPSTGIQYAFYELAAYYAAWYKTGSRPRIKRDVLYYFHRIEPAGGRAFGTKQRRPFALRFGGEATNDIELVAFLAAPGRISINTVSGLVSKDAPAGVNTLRAPLAPGRPSFGLARGGKSILNVASAFEVRSSSEFQDLLYRGGSSSRQPVSKE